MSAGLLDRVGYGLSVVLPFIEDRCTTTGEVESTTPELYRAFRSWCKQTRKIPCECHFFTLVLRETLFRNRHLDATRTFRWVSLGLDPAKQSTAPVGPRPLDRVADLEAFVSAECIPGGESHGPTLYRRYVGWAERTNRTIASSNAFSRMLSAAGYGYRRSVGVARWAGLTLAPTGH